MTDVPLRTHVASGVALADFAGETRILLMKRAVEGFWCHVAGKIEAGETAWQAIIREFAEETAIVVKELYSAEYLEQFYEAHANRISIIPVFVTRISAETSVRLNPEHTEFRWCTLDEALALVEYPGQKQLYRHVWQHFVDAVPSQRMRVKLG